MKFKVNIPVLFERTFGVTPNRGVQQLVDKVIDYKGVETLAQEQVFEFKSKLGVPVWDQVTIDEKVLEDTGVNFQGFTFPTEMAVEVSRPKNIVETEVVGMEGSVEEIISPADSTITFRGFLINYESDAYPEQEVRELFEVCALRDSTLGVTSNYLNNIGIEFLSLHNINLPQLAGYSNVQPFEITAKSKKPFILTANNGIEL